MDLLSPDEARLLGVLIEKQMTTPDQYPLTLNALVAGATQKNNRFPVIEMDDDTAYAAAESLRERGLAVRVEQSGARVSKYKHMAAERLDCRPAELALLAELLLRGAQTVGELRGRASRMQAFESIEAVSGFLRSMLEKPQPLVQRQPPAPGTRAEKYGQLLTGGETFESSADESGDGESTVEAAGKPADSALTDRVTVLEREVGLLRDALRKLATEIGAADPFTPPHSP
jgi:uncharacterized protein